MPQHLTLDQMPPADREVFLLRNTLLAALTGCLSAYPIITQDHSGPDRFNVHHSEGAWYVTLAEGLPEAQAVQLREDIEAFADRILPIRKGA